jgi:hypothetical protein
MSTATGNLKPIPDQAAKPSKPSTDCYAITQCALIPHIQDVSRKEDNGLYAVLSPE